MPIGGSPIKVQQRVRQSGGVWFIVGTGAGVATYVVVGVCGALLGVHRTLRPDADSIGLRAGVGLVAGEPTATPLVRRQITIRPSGDSKP